jgi:co-chaperonin GroES (HSP10)
MSIVKSLVMKNSHVLLREEPYPELTSSGLWVPPPKWKRRCRVIAACPTAEVAEGDIVLRNVGKGTDIELDGTEYEVLHSDWIIAVLV